MGKAQKGVTPALWKGKVGGVYFRQVGDETVISQMPDKKSVPDRYFDQMVQRVKMASMVNPYRLISPYFDYSFEKEKPSQTMYNLFIRYNKSANYTFFTKDEVEKGAAILRPFCISQGSLEPAIGVQEKDGKYEFDLSVGDLQLSASTKLIDFSTAIIQHSPFKKLQNGDALRVYICTQVFEVGNALPTIHCRSYKVDLETNTLRAQDKLLSQYIPADVFTLVPEADGNHLAIAAASNKMVAIVHSHRVRSKESERVIVTTQNLFGHNNLQQQFLTADRLEVAIDSFGGVNKENLLSPALRQRLTEAELEAEGTLGGGVTTQVTLTCSVVGSGGTVTPTETTVDQGSQVTFTAHPNSGKRVKRWSTGATSNTITVTASANQAYTVEFETDPNYNSGGDL